MKVLQVNCVYREGSTGKIVYDIHTELQQQGIESIVCYGRGNLVNEENVYKVCSEWYSKVNNVWSRITGVMYGGLRYSTHKLIQIIEREKPDIVHLHCINGYFVNVYKIISYLKNNNIKTVVTLHAEFMHTANCGHSFECERWKIGCGHCPRLRKETKSLFIDGTHQSWNLMKHAFTDFGNHIIIASVSPWLEKRARQSPIMSKLKHVTVLNGLDTTIFKKYDKKDCRKRFNIPLEVKVVFHATPFFTIDENHIKGGHYVCEVAKLMPDVMFIVAGQYAIGTEVPANVLLLGKVSKQTELAKLYAMADVTLLTSKRETFSMITAESLCCGTPIVGFKAGAPEEITLKEYSIFVEHGNIDALKNAVIKMMNLNFNSEQIYLEAIKKYAKEKMTATYIDIYRNLVCRKS